MAERLPPLLMTSEPDSFARKTIVERKPQLIRQAIKDNDYPPEIAVGLDGFRLEIAGQSIGLLTEDVADVAFGKLVAEGRPLLDHVPYVSGYAPGAGRGAVWRRPGHQQRGCKLPAVVG
jgi:hypothetical protein